MDHKAGMPAICFDAIPEHVKEMLARETLAAVRRFLKAQETKKKEAEEKS